MASLSTALHNGFSTSSIWKGFARCAVMPAARHLLASSSNAFAVIDNNRNCFCICPVHGSYSFCCCNTIHNRHHNIHQYGIKGSRRITFEILHRLSAVFCNCNLRTVICQQHFYDFSIKLIILDRQQMQSTNIILLCNFLILFLFPGNLKRMVMTNTDPTPT